MPLLWGYCKMTDQYACDFTGTALLGAFCNTLTCIKLTFVFKTFVLSSFEWPLQTGLTVLMPSLYLASDDIWLLYDVKITLPLWPPQGGCYPTDSQRPGLLFNSAQ